MWSGTHARIQLQRRAHRHVRAHTNNDVCAHTRTHTTLPNVLGRGTCMPDRQSSRGCYSSKALPVHCSSLNLPPTPSLHRHRYCCPRGTTVSTLYCSAAFSRWRVRLCRPCCGYSGGRGVYNPYPPRGIPQSPTKVTRVSSISE